MARPPRPCVFIGSSTEGKSVAEAIGANIADACDPVVWSHGVFEVGTYTLESLVSQLPKFDFAILVFSPDDFTRSRGRGSRAPRDNVLVELGLFIGGLGRHRTFVVFDSDTRPKIPSDLAGVTLAPYHPPESEDLLRAALGPACYDVMLAIRRLGRKPLPVAPALLPPTPPPPDQRTEQETIAQRIEENREVFGAQSPPPGIDLWYAQLRPVLHQSAYYTAPTYFLDCDLNIIDWNVAFELLFREILPVLRYRHVNGLIARLENCNQVFDHAKDFTRHVHEGKLPLADTEVLVYRSSRYGDVTMLKVATQLHEARGRSAGWAVALFPQSIDWPLFQVDVEKAIANDKMWSVYSASYDRILTQFPPYAQLLHDVTSVVPDTATAVIDIGAGTGNVTKVLLDRNLRVTSVELNATMIDKMRAKGFPSSRHRVVKASAENLDVLAAETFDGAILVNVLYSLEDPLGCLAGVNRILRRGGVLGLSTTHAGIRLDKLLASIKCSLTSRGVFDECEEDYEHLYEINKEIERTIARRHSAEGYRNMVRDAGFEILTSNDYTYEDAVMVVHARKR